MIRRLLVANRGEIARRLIRGAHDAGCEAVAVYAEDDAASPHVGEADVAVLLPGASLAETYLSTAALVGAAALTGADGLHPGYGFLSENPVLPEACAAAEGAAACGSARRHARHGAQGAGEGVGGPGRRARAAERSGGGRGR
jgi:acetyl/propionyl-CoA carboxylase alpha subunit